MSEPKRKPEDYAQPLIASPGRLGCAEAERAQPQAADRPAHGPFRGPLVRPGGPCGDLWAEAKAQVADLSRGGLAPGDPTLDEPTGERVEPASSHFSGKRQGAARGAHLRAWLRAGGGRHVPAARRIYHEATGGLTEGAHFRALPRAAGGRGQGPGVACFGAWRAGAGSLKPARQSGGKSSAGLKANRLIRTGFGPATRLGEAKAPGGGRPACLPGYGRGKAPRMLATSGAAGYRASDGWGVTRLGRQKWEGRSRRAEGHHEGIEPCRGVGRRQARRGGARGSHVGLAIRAFLRLEASRWRAGISWLSAKPDVTRAAVAAYLRAPHILPPQPGLAAA